MSDETRAAMWAGKRIRRAAWPAGSFIALIDGTPAMHIDGKPVPHPLSQREFMATDWQIDEGAQPCTPSPDLPPSPGLSESSS